MPEQTKPRGKSILIVEDDPIVRAALAQILSQMGYTIITVATVAES